MNKHDDINRLPKWRLKENGLLIALCWGWMSINFFLSTLSAWDKSSIVVGILCLLAIPCCALDVREDMRNNSIVFLSYLGHIILTLFIVLTKKIWWIIPVYIVEICLSIMFFKIFRKRISKVKRKMKTRIKRK